MRESVSEGPWGWGVSTRVHKRHPQDHSVELKGIGRKESGKEREREGRKGKKGREGMTGMEGMEGREGRKGTEEWRSELARLRRSRQR